MGLIHLLDAIGNYHETRYIFWLCIALIVGSLATGLPNATGDIGNWTEPLGLASLFVEAAVTAVAVGARILVPPHPRWMAGMRSIPRVMADAA